MSHSLDSLPNPDDVWRVDAALASLGLDLAQAATNEQVGGLATSLFATAAQLLTGIEVPTVVEHVNRALDAHAMDFFAARSIFTERRCNNNAKPTNNRRLKEK